MLLLLAVAVWATEGFIMTPGRPSSISRMATWRRHSTEPGNEEDGGQEWLPPPPPPAPKSNKPVRMERITKGDKLYVVEQWADGGISFREEPLKQATPVAAEQQVRGRICCVWYEVLMNLTPRPSHLPLQMMPTTHYIRYTFALRQPCEGILTLRLLLAVARARPSLVVLPASPLLPPPSTGPLPRPRPRRGGRRSRPSASTGRRVSSRLRTAPPRPVWRRTGEGAGERTRLH